MSGLTKPSISTVRCIISAFLVALSLISKVSFSNRWKIYTISRVRGQSFWVLSAKYCMCPVNTRYHSLNTFQLDNIFTHLLQIIKYCNRQGLIPFERKSKNNPRNRAWLCMPEIPAFKRQTRRPLVRTRPKLHSRNCLK